MEKNAYISPLSIVKFNSEFTEDLDKNLFKNLSSYAFIQVLLLLVHEHDLNRLKQTIVSKNMTSE